MLPAKGPTLEGALPRGPSRKALTSRGRCPLLRDDLGSQHTWPCSELTPGARGLSEKGGHSAPSSEDQWEPVSKGRGESVCVSTSVWG